MARKGPNSGGDISTEYPSPLRRRYIYSKTIDTVIVVLTTDDGLVGYGEAKAPDAPQATKEIIDRLLAGIVLGADARDVTVLWERMYAGMRVRGHRAGFYLEAMSGVDIALWDLAGKAAGVPIIDCSGARFVTSCESTHRACLRSIFTRQTRSLPTLPKKPRIFKGRDIAALKWPWEKESREI